MWNPIRRSFPRAAGRHRRTVQGLLNLSNEEQGCIWQHLQKLRNPKARVLAQNMSRKNPYLRLAVYSPFHEALSNAKKQYPDHAIALFTGQSYELNGVDAIMCVEHCGIQSKGLAPHVEIAPDDFMNVANRLRSLGIKVAVYKTLTELCADDKYDTTVPKKSIVFSHVMQDVSAAESDVPVLTGTNDGKAAGLTFNKHGYSISIIRPTSLLMEVHDRLTLTAAVSLIQESGARVILFQNGNSNVKKLLTLLSNVCYFEPLQGRLDAKAFHTAVCANIKSRMSITDNFKVVDVAGIKRVSISLDRDTAVAFGLSDDNDTDGPGIAQALHLQLLPEWSHYYMKHYMRFLLTRVLPPEIADDVRYINRKLQDMPLAPFDTKPISAKKIRKLLSQHQVDVSLIEDIYSTLNAYMYYMEGLPPTVAKKLYTVALSDLGIVFKMEQSKKDAQTCLSIVEANFNCKVEGARAVKTGIACVDDLFKQSEIPFSFLKRSTIRTQWDHVDLAACELLKAILVDYMGLPAEVSEDIEYRQQRNILSTCISKGLYSRKYIQKHIVYNDLYLLLGDMSSALDHRRLTTVETVVDGDVKLCYHSQDVKEALLNYRNKCSLAQAKARILISHVRKLLSPYAQSLVVISHFLVVFQTLTAHVSMALEKGWNMPTMTDGTEISLQRLIPVCIDPDDVIPMSANLQGVHVLSDRNNSGRSTFMRAVMSCCMAATRGLFVPCGSGSKVPRFTRFIFHAPTYHAEVTSALVNNMRSIEHILTTADSRTLVAIDNLGSNLVVPQGTALTGCFIRKMLEKGSTTIVATNLTGFRQEYLHGSHVNMLKVNNGIMELLPASSELYKPRSDGIVGSSIVKALQDEMQEYVELRGAVEDSLDDHSEVTLESNNKEAYHIPNMDRFPPYFKQTLSSVMKAVKEVCDDDIKKKMTYITEGSFPPPLLNQVPAVYILFIPIRSRDEYNEPILSGNPINVYDEGHSKGASTAVYIGETGNLTGRLRIHRSRAPSSVEEYFTQSYMTHELEVTEYLKSKNDYKREEDNRVLHWEKAHAIAFKMETRMSARIIERRLIKRLQHEQHSLVLLSHRDGLYRKIAPVD